MIWDARRRCLRKTGVIALPVHLPDDKRPLFLVASRPGYGRKPWYLITTEPVFTAEQAWQIEMSLRFTKSELAFESPRLHSWEARLKFLLSAFLAYALLLSNTDFLFPFDFQILSSNRKVEPRHLSSTLSLTSSDFSPVA